VFKASDHIFVANKTACMSTTQFVFFRALLGFTLIQFITGISLQAQVNLSNGLVAYYPFNGNALDASGNGNHGAASGSAAYGTDPWGNPSSCVTFGGTANAGKVQVTDSPTLGFSTGATFAFWARVNSATGTSGTGQVVAGGSQCLFAKSGDAGGGLWQLSQRIGSDLNHQIGNNGMSAFTGTIAPYVLGEWFHYVLTMDATGHNVYINGVLSSSNTTAANFGAMTNRNLAIGRFVSNWYPLNGAIDEFRVYNRVLNGDEIAALQEGQLIAVSIASSIDPGYCAGSTITVDFTTTGDLAGGNVYTLQMSNASGSFAAPVATGTLTSSVNSGSISLVIPQGLPSGTGYRLRLLSSAPGATSDASNEFEVFGLLGDIPDSGALTYIGTSGEASFFLSNTNLSWTASAAHAQNNGGHLAVIPNSAANILLQSAVQSTGAWIGFSDAAIEGAWTWVNGAPVTYTNWSSGEPNNSSNEDYGSMLPTGAWNDANNNITPRYLFQLAPAGLNQTVCEGETIQLQAAFLEGASYTWTGPNDFFSNEQNPTISGLIPAQSGIYSVTFDRNGCSAAASVSVTVNQAPSQPDANVPLLASLSEGLLLHYPMNGDATDASGNGNDGTLVGGITPVSDRFGNTGGAVQLNGSTGFIDVPDDVYFTGSAFTVTSWINKQANNSFSRLFDFGNGAQSDNVLVFLTNGTNGRAGFQNFTGNSAQSTTTSPNAQPLNEWFHLAYSWSNGIGRLFINGIQVVQGNQNVPTDIERTINYIGRSNWPNDGYAHARLDDFRIYGRELSLVELRALVMEQSESLLAYATPEVACASSAAQIMVEHSQFGVNYQLQNANTLANVGTGQPGNGNTLTFNTGILAQTTSFQIVATSLFSTCTETFPSIEIFVGAEPPAPIATGDTLCLSGEATLQVSGASGNAFYQWYTTPTGGAAIANNSGDSLNTGLINESTTYYVSIVYGDGCESARIPVVAEVIQPLNPPVDIQSDLILHYTFDGTFDDLSGNNYHGTASGSNTFVNDRNGNAESALSTFATGSPGNNWINAGNPGEVQQLTNQVTISAWIRQTQTWFGSDGFDGQIPLINKWDGNTGLWMGLRMINPANMSNRIRWRIDGNTFMESNTNVPIGAWHHVVCTYNGAQLRIYQNGVLTGTLNYTGTISNTGADLYLGRQANGTPSGGLTYRGDWDEVKMYERALNAEEILTLYNNESVAFANTPLCDEEGNLQLTTFTFPNATYNWTGPNGFSSSEQNPDTIINADSELNGGVYTLEVTVSGCTSLPQYVNAVIYEIPDAPITEDYSLCGNGDALLTASGAPEGAVYNWYLTETSVTPIAGQTDSTLILPNPQQTTLRWVSITANGCEGPRSSVAAIYNNPLQTDLVMNGSDVCEGASTAMISIEDSEVDVTYQAFQGDVPVSGIISGGGLINLEIDATMLSTGSNILAISASQPGCGSVNLDNTAVVHVLEVPTANIIADAPLSLCDGESLTLTSDESSSYTWSTGENSQSIMVSDAGTYTLVVEDENGCISNPVSATVSVIEVPQPAIVANGSTAICPGNTITITASGGTNYLWSDGSTGNTLVTGIPGDYSVTVFNEQCSANSEVITITQLPMPAVSASVSNSEVCPGSSIILTGSGADSYTWNQGAINNEPYTIDESTTFIVTGSLNGGCSATDTIEVTVLNLPTAIISSNLETICPGEIATLSAAAVNGADYQWYFNGELLEGATAQTLSTTNPGNYVVQVNSNCSAFSNSIAINESSFPGDLGDIAGPTDVCSGATAQYNISAINDVSSYIWSITPEGAASIASGQGTQNVLINTPNGDFTIHVTAQNGCGIGEESSIAVEVNSGFPCFGEVNFEASVTTICIENQVEFINYTDSEFFIGYSPLWNFGEGATPATSTSDGPILVTYSTPGEKTVSLDYVDAFGNSIASEVKTNYILVAAEVNTSPIEGATEVSCDTPLENYSVLPTAGSAYQWSVPAGAQIISGQGTPDIAVAFNGNFGQISVTETGVGACIGDPITLNIECFNLVDQSEMLPIIAYPNPLTDRLMIDATLTQGIVLLQLFDETGRKLKEQNLTGSAVLPFEDYASGIYLLVIKQGSRSKSLKIVKL
jgi:hypothetical protein